MAGRSTPRHRHVRPARHRTGRVRCGDPGGKRFGQARLRQRRSELRRHDGGLPVRRQVRGHHPRALPGAVQPDHRAHQLLQDGHEACYWEASCAADDHERLPDRERDLRLRRQRPGQVQRAKPTSSSTRPSEPGPGRFYPYENYIAKQLRCSSCPGSRSASTPSWPRACRVHRGPEQPVRQDVPRVLELRKVNWSGAYRDPALITYLSAARRQGSRSSWSRRS